MWEISKLSYGRVQLSEKDWIPFPTWAAYSKQHTQEKSGSIWRRQRQVLCKWLIKSYDTHGTGLPSLITLSLAMIVFLFLINCFNFYSLSCASNAIYCPGTKQTKQNKTKRNKKPTIKNLQLLSRELPTPIASVLVKARRCFFYWKQAFSDESPGIFPSTVSSYKRKLTIETAMRFPPIRSSQATMNKSLLHTPLFSLYHPLFLLSFPWFSGSQGLEHILQHSVTELYF